MTDRSRRVSGVAPPLRPRARDLRLPFPGVCGACNAVTDVPGVEVGYATLVRDPEELPAGRGPVRTGVTVLLPRGRAAGPAAPPVWAGFHALNGNGEMTGTHWIREGGAFTGPVGLTNTHSVGIVHQALARWMAGEGRLAGPYQWTLPVVAETCDAYLNDMNGFHVGEAHVIEAIEAARGGPVAEGNVGGGTGMVCFEFKGGTGTASRLVGLCGGAYTVGCLVQANFGLRPHLRVLGVPVGEHLTAGRLWSAEQGSIIAVVATDAPLMPTQLERVARRAGLGVGRTGTPSGDGSGDLCLAFSTANPVERTPGHPPGLGHLAFLLNEALDPLFEATAQAVEEAIVNALLAADTMTGLDSRRVEAIDRAALVEVMQSYNRLGA